MKTYAGSFLLLFVAWIAFGQDQPTAPPENPSPTRELLKIASSDPVKTFAEAFEDPNIIIGVFEYPKEITSDTVSEEVLAFLDGYWAAQEKVGIRMLRCVKVINGDVPRPAVFVCDRLVPDQGHDLRIPSFVPVPGSQWILALQKTTRQSRMARFGEEINKYAFLDDHSLFGMYHYGYGALCLQWPSEDRQGSGESRRARVVPQTLVDDFVEIQRVLSCLCKDTITTGEAAAIGSAWRRMKTPMGKSVLLRVFETGASKSQDSSSGSK